jgi:hypothetical protein
MRRQEELSVLMQVFATIASALQGSHYFMLLEFGLEVIQRKLVLSESFALDDQHIFVWIDVRHSKMVAGIEQFIRCDIVLREKVQPGLSAPRLHGTRKSVRVSDGVSFEPKEANIRD